MYGHHLRCHPLLFHNFKQFNLNATAVLLHVIQKEAHDLLSKKAIEPSTDGAGFYANVFVVPKHIGGL